MTPLLAGRGLEGLLIASLVFGHAAADFVFQSGAMARNKRQWKWLLAHVGVVVLVQAAALLPFLTERTAIVVLAIAALHGVIDLTKARLAERPGLGWLFFDQALHGAVLLGAWLFLRGEPIAPYLPALRPERVEALTRIAVIGTAYAVSWSGAAAVVVGVLQRFGLANRPAETAGEAAPSRGRVIGILERMLALTLVLIGQWGGLGLLLAAKSIARFRDLEDREMSEYYLIGTLTSLLCAVLCGIAVGMLV